MTGTYAAAVRRILIGRVAATIGGLVAVLGTFLPWLRSGTRRRNSYDIFSLVDRLGFSPSSIIGWAVRLWPLAPFLLALTVTFVWFPRKWIGRAIAIVAVAYVGIVSVAVRSARSSSLIRIESGPLVTLAGAIVLAAGAAVVLSG
jgi:hypothetical protein